MFESQTYITSGIIKAVFTKDGTFVTTVTNEKRLKDYPLSKYLIVDII